MLSFHGFYVAIDFWSDFLHLREHGLGLCVDRGSDLFFSVGRSVLVGRCVGVSLLVSLYYRQGIFCRIGMLWCLLVQKSESSSDIIFCFCFLQVMCRILEKCLSLLVLEFLDECLCFWFVCCEDFGFPCLVSFVESNNCTVPPLRIVAREDDRAFLSFESPSLSISLIMECLDFFSRDDLRETIGVVFVGCESLESFGIEDGDILTVHCFRFAVLMNIEGR